MIVVRITGGLGNQMFQYALGRKLSLRENDKLILNLSSYNNYHLYKYSLDSYNIQCEKINTRLLYNNKYFRKVAKLFSSWGIKRYFRYYIEKKLFVFDKDVLTTKADYFLGSWQSFKYFEDVADVIANDFRLQADLNTVCMDMIQQMRFSESVALHVRRGDYFADKRTKNEHGILGMDYYEQAIQFVCNKIRNPMIYIFSDDIDWVKSNFNTKYQVHYVDGSVGGPEFSIYLMSKCKHNIISNSTFSWWGAWLNQNPEKIVVSPEFWIRNNRTSTDLVPKEWHTL